MPVGQPFVVLPVTDSTNNYAMGQVKAGLAGAGAVFLALEQTAGKGQRGRSWAAKAGENIMMSAVLAPEGFSASNPFPLSAAVALGCYHFFKTYGSAEMTRIKWPNDLYWQDRKAGGILIENLLGANGAWKWAIVGMGLNINQAQFPPELPNPVSLKQITGKEHDIVQLARELCHCVQSSLDLLHQKGPAHLLEQYNEWLYKKGEKVWLKKDQVIFETTIVGVTARGELHTRDAMERVFTHGEVEWVKREA